MTRIDRLVTLRIASHIAIVIAIFFGLIALVESLDGYRFNYLSDNQGQLFGFMAIVVNAARWSMRVLPVTVLLGAILALLNLAANRELVIAKASGLSIWRLLRGPFFFIIALALVISFFVESKVAELNRIIIPIPRTNITAIGDSSQVWLRQNAGEYRYVIHGTRAGQENHVLSNLTFYLPATEGVSRIKAERGTLNPGEWQLENAILFGSNREPQRVANYRLETVSTRAELELRLADTQDFTLFELRDALASELTDPLARDAAAMRYAKLLALPALLVGSLLIAFAFTAGYRRAESYGGTVIYGIVLGFVVFVITEMADRAGAAGILDPTFAAWGPATVAIVTGLTVLLHKEDGRA